jgi:hypothetical protein
MLCTPARHHKHVTRACSPAALPARPAAPRDASRGVPRGGRAVPSLRELRRGQHGRLRGQEARGGRGAVRATFAACCCASWGLLLRGTRLPPRPSAPAQAEAASCGTAQVPRARAHVAPRWHGADVAGPVRRRRAAPPGQPVRVGERVYCSNSPQWLASFTARVFLLRGACPIRTDHSPAHGRCPWPVTRPRRAVPPEDAARPPLQLCSSSLWDAERERCALRGNVQVINSQYTPGGALCNEHAADLATCPRVWA